MAQGRKGKNERARRELVKPTGLTPAQDKLWDYTVSSQSASWQIPGMEPLLYAFVASACILRALYAKREKAMVDPDFDFRAIEDLEEIIDKGERKLAAHATKLRLTPQSRTKETDPQDRPLMPWDMHPDGDDGDTA